MSLKFVIRKSIFTLLIILISSYLILPLDVAQAAVSPQIADFLCDKGIFYYDNGKYAQAIQEFKKALLANSGSVIAKEYLSLLMKKTKKIDPERKVLSQAVEPEPNILKTEADKSYVEVKNLEEDIIKNIHKPKLTQENIKIAGQNIVSAPEHALNVLDINDQQLYKNGILEMPAYMESSFIVKGKNISRFFSDQPAYLTIERKSADELQFDPMQFGETFVYVWDDMGRKTIKLKIGPSHKFEEQFRKASLQEAGPDLAAPFKLSYSASNGSFYSGRGIGDQKRQGLFYTYSSSLVGETPFGNFDSAIHANRDQSGQYSVTNLRMGITEGHYDNLKDITLRWFDFTPTFGAFGFPAADLRGVLLEAPMFDKKLSYSAFNGALLGGFFSTASNNSGLSQTRKAWLEGLGVNYSLTNELGLRSFYVQSSGPDRAQPVLTNKVSGLGTFYHHRWFNASTEMASDYLGNISYTGRTGFNFSRLRMGLSMTESNKNFASVFGGQPATGSTSGTLTADYLVSDNVRFSNTLSGYRDKVFGNPDRPTRPNYDSDSRIYWNMDPHTTMEFGYRMRDQMGTISPSVTELKDVTYRKQIFFIRRLNTFLTYQNSKSKYFTSSAQNFNNNSILGGFSARLVGQLYGSYTRQLNFLYNKFSGESSDPSFQEFALNYYRQIFTSPYYLRCRLVYHDEERTGSLLSYLSGEDRLEGEGELTFRPNPDTECFLKARVAEIWAEREGVAKRMDLELDLGVSFAWDTGLRWNTVGSIYGYVFYDLNADGIKQPQEKGVPNVEMQILGRPSVKTNSIGYYKLDRVVGKTAKVLLNSGSIPAGYSVTSDAQ
ncbi:MAG: hypothetical protein COX96_01370, partial [Candidatus Omnitrophica bacterium CG_4_10_14_0_2_um_filter_44_9]